MPFFKAKKTKFSFYSQTDIIMEHIVEFLGYLFCGLADKICKTREVPKIVKILFIILCFAIIIGVVIFFYWKFSR